MIRYLYVATTTKMAKTVIAAFNEFMENFVNLDNVRVEQARRSRDWLVERIEHFPDDSSFPSLHPDRSIGFGSFARGTKKRPLDDIDLMIILHAEGATYREFGDGICVIIPDQSSRLRHFCDGDSPILNSIKIVNKFVESLKGVQQYENAEIKRNREAATLRLRSYEWNFDIVPCFLTKADSHGRTYYVIPDGQGNWKKTDPRLDKDRVKRINSMYGGRVLEVVRVVKYWNKRAKIPTMESYLLENIILDYYENHRIPPGSHIRIEFCDVMRYLSQNIFKDVEDPKGVQGNINLLEPGEKNKISEIASIIYKKANLAIAFEKVRMHEASINKWREIFGDNFPM